MKPRRVWVTESPQHGLIIFGTEARAKRWCAHELEVVSWAHYRGLPTGMTAEGRRVVSLKEEAVY